MRLEEIDYWRYHKMMYTKMHEFSNGSQDIQFISKISAGSIYFYLHFVKAQLVIGLFIQPKDC